MKKKLFRLSLALAAVLVLFAGCGKDEEIEENNLYGTWDADDGFYYTFTQDHNGVSGDIDSPNDKLPFTWSLDYDELNMRFTESGKGRAKISAHLTFVIDKLSSTRMEAYDKYDPNQETVVFTKR